MLKRSLGLVSLWCVLLLPRVALAQTYAVFDLPAAQGVYPLQINARGDIVGRWHDSAGLPHGFIRHADGRIVTFEVPGAVEGTYPQALRDDGTVVGFAAANPTSSRGFVRLPDGSLIALDLDASKQTLPFATNNAGDVAGQFVPDSANALPRGFILSATGVLTPLGESTLPTVINPQGDVAGTVGDDGFVRSAGGVTNRFTADSPLPGVVRTQPTGINALGMVVGWAHNERCSGEFCQVLDARGFVRRPDGRLTVFRLPGSGSAGTVAQAINSGGTVAGYAWPRAARGYVGFLRTPGGRMTSFAVPDMAHTYAKTINDAGVVAGHCTDADGHVLGFVRLP